MCSTSLVADNNAIVRLIYRPTLPKSHVTSK